jgi:guanylate kinase
MAETSLQSSEVATSKQGATGAGNLVVITGPSGVGKGTLVERLIAAVPGLSLSVSVTTRPQRPEEVEGTDYFFRSEKQFRQMVANDELLEWAEFAGALYGTPKAWVEKQLSSGHDVVLEIEVQGARQIQKQCSQAVLIFLSPPDFPALEERLRKRATETPEKIALRLSKAREEMKQRHLFHYEVVNDNIDEALNNLVHIIYAERCRIRPSPGNESK